jgi:hypothetical protein
MTEQIEEVNLELNLHKKDRRNNNSFRRDDFRKENNNSYRRRNVNLKINGLFE